VEIRGPVPEMLCEEHARDYLEDMPGERWQDYGAESPVEYARFCEDAVDALTDLMETASNPVLYDAPEEAFACLEAYALWPARKALVRAGETPRPTREELRRLSFFRESAERFGWTDRPEWVERWLAKLRENEGSKA
jgi:hypothetical protein